MQIGDTIRQADGTTGTVQAVQIMRVRQRMYNLTVDVAHTFFVGQQSWWVHNCNGEKLAKEFGLDPNSSPATKPYQRPSGSVTDEQRAYVQGKPCVTCGVITPKQIADHKNPLVVEYYQNGSIDVDYMRSLDAVQSQCPTCSNSQGGLMSQLSRYMRKELFGK